MRGEHFSTDVPTTTEDPLEKQSKNFVAFLRKGNYTADQIREAYYRLVEVSDSQEKDIRVQEILTEMQKLVADHFPINRFVRIIEFKQDFEDSVKIFEQYVEDLEISFNEKKMLRSLVKKKRDGELVFHIEGEKMASIKIVIGGSSEEAVASELMGVIKECLEHVSEGQKYEFIFTT